MPPFPELPDGPSLRLLRLRYGLSQPAVARALGRRPARVGELENNVVVSPHAMAAYVDACNRLVQEREALTINDLQA